MRELKLSRAVGVIALTSACVLATSLTRSQEPTQAPASSRSTQTATDKQPELPAQIDLLQTHVRFEANGDSRKEVHTRVRINNELGVRQFARLNFDYNRAFQQIELPLMRITHSSGGTVDILPSAISDQPNPAVVDFPAYHDVRVKSVRILGLEPGDTLEYRIVTNTTHHPLAPDFWLDHAFDRSGVVTHEIFELDLPNSRTVQLRTNPAAPVSTKQQAEDRRIYYWDAPVSHALGTSNHPTAEESDVALTTFADWQQLAEHLEKLLRPTGNLADELRTKASELARVPKSDSVSTARARASAFYTFVSEKIKTVDLPLGSTGFVTRKPSEVLASGYGTPEDKYALFAGLANSYFGPARAGLILTSSVDQKTSIPRPTVFNHLLTLTGWPSINIWLDLNIEVAPFQVIPSEFRRKNALIVGPAVNEFWRKVDDVLPFPAKQSVSLEAAIADNGELNAKVRYTMRGDNELLLRVAFHQAPKDKWKEVTQLLALSDGFRGKVSRITASDPYATNEPFTVEYEITQTRFVDWSKKPVRIPALLPLMALPEAAARTGGAPSGVIDLGTPLDVQTRVTLHVPPNTSISAPAGTSVERDYATFSSEYSARNLALAAERHINFLQREIPADRAADYAAFVHAVQNDQAQEFTLERGESAAHTQKGSGTASRSAAIKP